MTNDEARAKELAIIKASNEMLEQSKMTMIEQGIADEGIIKQITDAQNENLMYAQTRHGATPEEVSQSRYHGASINAVKKYQKRLESRGLTDEMVHQKAIATATVTKSKPAKKERVKGIGFVDGDLKEETTKKRRTRKTKKEETEKSDTVKEKNKKETEVNIKTVAEEFVETVTQEAPELKIGSKVLPKGDDYYEIDNFNLDDIPDYVQYDIIPLPSKGECYAHKKGKIPVGYLTASDENVIASPNMYRDGKILDVMLRRKILDKSINVDELCEGDRDAIILWLRATAYGDDYPIYVTNPKTGNRIDTSVKLSEFKYDEFNLKGDENGCFDYETSNGDIIKFKFLTHNQESKLLDEISKEVTNTNKVTVIKSLATIREALEFIDIDDEDANNINEDLEEIASVIGSNFTKNLDNVFTTSITKRMVMHTYSINGNTDKEYIKAYVENMRTKEASRYRQYINDNKPGVDFRITVNVPESDGGGSFDTFLRIEDSVFLNT